jgi:hypothetical protein
MTEIEGMHPLQQTPSRTSTSSSRQTPLPTTPSFSRQLQPVQDKEFAGEEDEIYNHNHGSKVMLADLEDGGAPIDYSPEAEGGLRRAWSRQSEHTPTKKKTTSAGRKPKSVRTSPAPGHGQMKLKPSVPSPFPVFETYVPVPDGFMDSLSMEGWQRAGAYLEVMGRVVKKHMVLGGVASALGDDVFQQVDSASPPLFM